MVNDEAFTMIPSYLYHEQTGEQSANVQGITHVKAEHEVTPSFKMLVFLEP